MTGNAQTPGAARPSAGDLALLELLASGRSAAAAAEELSVPLRVVAERLQHVREHYGVDSTAAALRRAAADGHLVQRPRRDHQDEGRR